jgi:co-chaperonin GroES (HSP10)
VKDMVVKAKEIEANIANGIVLTSQMVKTKDAAEICLDDL